MRLQVVLDYYSRNAENTSICWEQRKMSCYNATLRPQSRKGKSVRGSEKVFATEKVSYAWRIMNKGTKSGQWWVYSLTRYCSTGVGGPGGVDTQRLCLRLYKEREHEYRPAVNPSTADCEISESNDFMTTARSPLPGLSAAQG